MISRISNLTNPILKPI